MKEEKTVSFVNERISEEYKKLGKNWREDMPYDDRPFDIKGLVSEEIEDMIDFGIDAGERENEEPPHTLVFLKNKKVLFIRTKYSASTDFYVLGIDGWEFANEMTKTQLKKFMR